MGAGSAENYLSITAGSDLFEYLHRATCLQGERVICFLMLVLAAAFRGVSDGVDLLKQCVSGEYLAALRAI